MPANPKATMKCGEIRKSSRAGKKIMKLYCINGKKRLVHAGSTGYGNNYSDAARKSFKARQKCSTAKVHPPIPPPIPPPLCSLTRLTARHA